MSVSVSPQKKESPSLPKNSQKKIPESLLLENYPAGQPAFTLPKVNPESLTLQTPFQVQNYACEGRWSNVLSPRIRKRKTHASPRQQNSATKVGNQLIMAVVKTQDTLFQQQEEHVSSQTGPQPAHLTPLFASLSRIACSSEAGAYEC